MGLSCHRALRLRYGLLFLMCFCVVWTFYHSYQIPVLVESLDLDYIDRPQNRDYWPPANISSHNVTIESMAKTGAIFRPPQSRDFQFDLEASDALKALNSFKKQSARLVRHEHPENYVIKRNITKPYRPTIGPYIRKYPRVIYYIHIHKSAGTMICRLAYKNKVNANQDSNCNVQDDQYCCGGEDTLLAQMEYANRTYWDLVSIEREMYDSMAPDYYDYVVTLRDCKERYYSHWSHLRRVAPVGPGVQTGGFGNSAWIVGNNTIVNRRIKERRIPPDVDPLGNFQEWILGQPDNWNTRILCGVKCRNQAKYQISQELFNYTLQRADKFAHFLFVEDMEASYNQVARAYQWREYSEVATTYLTEKKSNRRQDKHEVESKLAQEGWDPLVSALDDALYEFAKRKFHGHQDPWRPFRNQANVDLYFSEGVKRGCLDACCGNCSSY